MTTRIDQPEQQRPPCLVEGPPPGALRTARECEPLPPGTRQLADGSYVITIRECGPPALEAGG
jgi:hypothetical protein